jgi:hypothetical protein
VSRVRVSFDERGEVVEYELLRRALADFTFDDDAEVTEYERGYRAMMLAPTLEICRALLRGESVPIDQLDQAQLARYGLRNCA